MIRRAYVGFSSPSAYDYTKDELNRSSAITHPEPIIVGTMGLYTLYDEIWFPLRSQCPPSMRELPYVKFLEDLPSPGGIFDSSVEINFHEEGEAHFPGGASGLELVFEDGFSDGVQKYLRRPARTDNHGRGEQFFGRSAAGNITKANFLLDLWTIDEFHELKLELVLNRYTIELASSVEGGLPQEKVDWQARKIELAERLITFNSLHDLIGSRGPYHPCIEEIRDDDLLIEFRRWMNDQTTRLDNQTMRDIEQDVDQKIYEFNMSASMQKVAKDGLSSVVVDIAKDEIFGKVPFYPASERVVKAVNRNKEISSLRWRAFIARAQHRLRRAGDRRP